MPGIGTGNHRYWPQLDGVRALAISAVVAYHLGYLPGGWVGVDVFFVLSGYLITSLLLERAEKRGDRGAFAGIRGFWGRSCPAPSPGRAGPPGSAVALLRPRGARPGPGPAAATGTRHLVLRRQLAADRRRQQLFHQFTAPSPLQHTWSLAIEEQYYLVWPLLLGVLQPGCSRGDGPDEPA